MMARHVADSQGRANLVLATLFSGMFVMGSAEMMVVGVLNLIAADLHVSIPAAGALVTANALGIAIGGPLLTALTIRFDRRDILLAALLGFSLVNLTPVLSGSYSVFLAARVVGGALMGLFIGAAFEVGTSVVPTARMGRAISVLLSGVALSAAIGVPLGTLLGQALGWRGSFAAVVVLTVLALLATWALAPRVPSRGGGAGRQAKYALAPRVLAVLLLNFLLFGAIGATMTYIVPFLGEVTGISGALISLYLLAYGMATAVGSIGGGRFADRNAARTLIVAGGGLALALLSLYLFGAMPLMAGLSLVAMGLVAMGMAPSMQYRVISLAGPGAALAQALPASAVNLGVAFGSYAGGVAITQFSTASTVLTGVVIAVIAIPVALATSSLKPPVAEEEASLSTAILAEPVPDPA